MPIAIQTDRFVVVTTNSNFDWHGLHGLAYVCVSVWAVQMVQSTNECHTHYYELISIGATIFASRYQLCCA